MRGLGQDYKGATWQRAVCVHRTGRQKEEIMRLKNSVPVCLCAFDPQATPFRDSRWLMIEQVYEPAGMWVRLEDLPF